MARCPYGPLNTFSSIGVRHNNLKSGLLSRIGLFRFHQGPKRGGKFGRAAIHVLSRTVGKSNRKKFETGWEKRSKILNRSLPFIVPLSEVREAVEKILDDTSRNSPRVGQGRLVDWKPE